MAGAYKDILPESISVPRASRNMKKEKQIYISGQTFHSEGALLLRNTSLSDNLFSLSSQNLYCNSTHENKTISRNMFHRSTKRHSHTDLTQSEDEPVLIPSSKTLLPC